MVSRSLKPKSGFHIRKAIKQDSQIILKFIKELAAYENMEDEVIAKIKDINDTLFND